MTETIQVIGQGLKEFGLALVLLAACGVFFWRILVWLKPWVEKAINSHIGLIGTLQETLTKLSTGQENQQKTQEKVQATQEKVQEVLEGLAANQSKTHELVREVRHEVVQLSQVQAVDRAIREKKAEMEKTRNKAP